MEVKRRILPALLISFSLGLASSSSGDTAAPAAAKGPEKAAAAVPATASKSLRVAVLPVVNGTGEDEANPIMEDVLRDEFALVDPARAMFLMPQDVERLLNDENATDRAYKLTDRWAKYGTLDSTSIAGMDSLLVADAVMMVKVSEWETKRAHNIGEGQSSTTIGLHFVMYRISDKKKLWSKDEREQRMARELDISSATVGYDETGRIQTPGTTDPPRVHDVATDLVRDALKKFPNK